MKKVLFISSTGGHFNELMQLKPLMEEYDYHIITEKTKTNSNLKEKYGKDKVDFLVYGTKKNLFAYFFKFAWNWIKSLYFLFKLRPDVLVTTGTHTAVPMCYLSKLFRTKVIYIETFANRTTPTVAGRLIYPVADTFVVQWENMLQFYPKAVCWGWIY